MVNKDAEEELFPTTIKGALELYLAGDFEFDLIHGLPKNKMDWLYANLKREIINLCDLRENKKLRTACGSENTTAEEAARMIIETIWEYFNPQP